MTPHRRNEPYCAKCGGDCDYTPDGRRRIDTLWRVRGSGIESGGLFYESLDGLREKFPESLYSLVQDKRKGGK